MTIEEKIQMNKVLRKYEGDNTFALSLKKQLKSSKYLNKETFNNKQVRVLSEKQYESVKSLI